MGRKYVRWTNEMLAEEALKYSTRREFQCGSGSAYQTARKRGLLDEICWLMIPQLIYWTNEMLAEEALKYSTRAEFARGSEGAYSTARKRGILDEICERTTVGRKYVRWTNEMLAEEALKYSTRMEFVRESYGAYQTARKRGLLDEICWLMIPQLIYWTNEMLAEEALKYDTRAEFKRVSYSAYQAAWKHGFLDEICDHMERGKLGFNPEKPGLLYYLAVDTRVYGTLYKIGITNYDVQTRFYNGDLEMIRVLQTIEYENGQDAYAQEQAILKEHAQYRFNKPDQILSSGNTELFTIDILGLDQQRMAA